MNNLMVPILMEDQSDSILLLKEIDPPVEQEETDHSEHPEVATEIKETHLYSLARMTRMLKRVLLQDTKERRCYYDIRTYLLFISNYWFIF